MENLIAQLEEILETTNLDLTKKFKDYDEWDSLSSLTIISLLDSNYSIKMTNAEILAFNHLAEFCEFVKNNAK
jgi:acyl carrier protein